MDSLWTERARKACVVYLAVYFANLVLNVCSVYIAFVPSVGRSAIGLGIMLAGTCFVARNVVYVIAHKIKVPKEMFLLLGIVAFMGLSGVANFQYGIVETLKIMVWSSILFFVAFPFFYSSRKCTIYRDLTIIVLPGFIIWALMVLVSLGLFYAGVQEYALVIPEYVRPRFIGIHYNRLVGVFNDASMGATLSWAMTLIAFYLLLGARNAAPKIILGVVVFFSVQYIVATGARSSMVVMAISSIAFLWLTIRRLKLAGADNKVLFQVLSLVGVSVAVVVMIFVGFSVIQSAMVECAKTTSRVISTEIGEIQFGPQEILEEDMEGISLERTDLEGKDITNLRADLWGDGLRAFLDKPLLGTSIDGFIPYVQEAYPDSFAAKGYDIGNGYLSVLVYSGLFAFILAIAFMVKQGWILCSWFVKSQMRQVYDCREYLIITILISIALSAAINMDIFYINYSSSFVWWLLLGALNSLCTSSEEEGS